MKLETELRLPNTLKKMGITDVFELRSDLSGISHQKPLFVSEVVHKAAIEVFIMVNIVSYVPFFYFVKNLNTSFGCL